MIYFSENDEHIYTAIQIIDQRNNYYKWTAFNKAIKTKFIS